MCPLRIILIFLSATLAGYFAWKTARSAADSSSLDGSGDEIRSGEAGADGSENDCCADVRKMIGGGFWTLVDMASGRYLWRNLREAKVR